MSKINPRTKSASKTVDERLAGGAGAKAAAQSNIALLRRVVLANLLWENVAYIDGESISKEIERLIPLCTPEDVANLTVEARTLQKLRHTPLFLAVQMCKHEAMKPLVADVLPQIITRADMLTDFLAIYWKENGANAPIANAAKKGLARAFHNFREYHFAKYDRDAAVKLRDVMFLCHPKPQNAAEETLFAKIASRTLKTPETWETMLSSGRDKKETFTYLINEGKLGGLAMLRNIRNMVDAKVDRRIIQKGLDTLNSTMLLPLSFLKAAKEAPLFARHIEDAMLKSYEHLPKLPGKTLFIVDVSGSMRARISSKSEFTRLQVAEAMAMLAANQCEDFELVCTAGSDWHRKHATIQVEYPQKGFGIIEQINNQEKGLGGGGIFTRQCLEWCENAFKGTHFDRIIVFSDSQDCDTSPQLPKPFGTHNYICDVSAEKKGVNYRGVWDAEVSGWSEHFLTYIASYEGLQNMFGE